MSANDYNFIWTDDLGRRIGDSQRKSIGSPNPLNPIDVSCSRVANGIGSLTMQMRPTFDTDLLARDNMIQVWRSGRLFNVYFLRRWRIQYNGSRRDVTIWAYDPNYLLTARSVMAYTDTSFAKATSEPADDLMKRIVTNALSDSLGTFPSPTSGTRALSRLSVQGNTSSGPDYTKDFSYDQLLTMSSGGILPKIAKYSRDQGNESFFAVHPSQVTSSKIAFQFQTKQGQPGADLTSQGIVFSLENNNLKNPSLDYDFTKEANIIYAVGKGQDDARVVRQAADSDRQRASVWNHRERAVDARRQDADGASTQAAEALTASRGVVSFVADVTTSASGFGDDWWFGDKVPVVFLKEQFNCIFRTVALGINQGNEDIRARLEYESVI